MPRSACRSFVDIPNLHAVPVPAKVIHLFGGQGYKRHASKVEPQYIIKSDTTDHIAIHKGSALKKIKKSKG